MGRAPTYPHNDLRTTLSLRNARFLLGQVASRIILLRIVPLHAPCWRLLRDRATAIGRREAEAHAEAPLRQGSKEQVPRGPVL